MDDYSTLRIAYFGHNRRDTAFVRRIRAFLDAGVEVTTFTFRRDGEPEHPGPKWNNVDLGHVEHAHFLRRLLLYVSALRSVIRNRDLIAQSNVLYARNLDVVVFAMFATRLALGLRKRQCLVYECLDVHEFLTRGGVVALIMRWIERRVLKKANLLVVSSPGFMRHYFEPVQGFSGMHAWVENKLYFEGKGPERLRAQSMTDAAPALDACVTIGWIGIIRCNRSLALLKALAIALPDKVRIKIAGLVSYFLIEDFDEQIAGIDNIEFHGPFEWPDGLADAYSNTDLVWAQELSWSGHNSDWLIPNRVYEASFFGVPSIGVGDTETSRIISDRRLGYVLAEESADGLIDFIQELDAVELASRKKNLIARPVAEFVADESDTNRLLQAIRTSCCGSSGPESR